MSAFQSNAIKFLYKLNYITFIMAKPSMPSSTINLKIFTLIKQKSIPECMDFITQLYKKKQLDVNIVDATNNYLIQYAVSIMYIMC